MTLLDIVCLSIVYRSDFCSGAPAGSEAHVGPMGPISQDYPIVKGGTPTDRPRSCGKSSSLRAATNPPVFSSRNGCACTQVFHASDKLSRRSKPDRQGDSGLSGSSGLPASGADLGKGCLCWAVCLADSYGVLLGGGWQGLRWAKTALSRINYQEHSKSSRKQSILRGFCAGGRQLPLTGLPSKL